jgi:hypothetical protein
MRRTLRLARNANLVQPLSRRILLRQSRREPPPKPFAPSGSLTLLIFSNNIGVFDLISGCGGCLFGYRLWAFKLRGRVHRCSFAVKARHLDAQMNQPPRAGGDAYGNVS